MLILGYHGESVSYSSGLISLIKGHGNTMRRFGGGGTDFEMNKTFKDAIILIRNPFEAIYSYRNFITKDLFGSITDASVFFGEGTNSYFNNVFRSRLAANFIFKIII